MKHSKISSPGQIVHGFKVERIIDIEELQAKLFELTHEATQAKVLHIENDDPENLFCLSFQTRPENSRGVAHILEHTVLCGSKKFPVKDPFFAMTRRSLNTFMNALTGADFTCYPAATQVHKDFYNLLEVYLDAVFHPNLNRLSFLQEGHRLEFAHPENPKSPLEHKGVVYNEMKGAMRNGNARLSEKLFSALFPNITYGINSGGDPKEIPELTYEELLSFHQFFYHPSRCLFFFYGNMSLEKHLEFIDLHALQGVEPVSKLPPIPLQKRHTQPVRQKFDYPIDQKESREAKTLIGLAWLTCHILNQEELLALNILEIILLDTDASPLKKALLKSGLCKQVSSYIDGEMNEVPFIISLKGCESKDADEIESLIYKEVRKFIDQGVSLEAFENALHQLEIYRSEITGDSNPFGLSLFMRAGLLKQHDALPESGLKIHSLFDRLRKKNLEDPHYFTALLKKHLIDNPHFVRIVMTPSPGLAEKEGEEEREGLKKILEALNEKQRKEIIEEAKNLESFQKDQAETSFDLLPKVTLEDVPPYPRDFPLHQQEFPYLKVFHHQCFTNQIVYADLFFDLPPFKQEDLPYLRLLATLIPQMGTGGRSYSDTLDFIQAHTGGVGASLGMNIQASDPSQYFPCFALRGKALERKKEKLFHILQDMLVSSDFSDAARLKEIIFKQYTSLESSLQQNALRYAVNLATGGLNLPSQMGNDWYGLKYYWFLKKLTQVFDSESKHLIKHLFDLQTKVFQGEPNLVLSCDQHSIDSLKGHHFYGLEKRICENGKPWVKDHTLFPVESQGRQISSPVAFTCLAFEGLYYADKQAPSLACAANLFDTLILHPKIREQGGAYGGGSAAQLGSGVFYFYSYRDPHIASTYQAFREAALAISQGDFEISDLEEAKLEVIQGLDAPVSPGSRAVRAYGWLREGKTPEMRLAYRQRLLNQTKEDIVEAVREHILPKVDLGSFVVFAGKELLEKENLKLERIGRAPLSIKTL